MSTRPTKKEHKFVQEWVEHGNGTRAALVAYDTTSENTAAAIASENLRKPKIIKAIEDALPDHILNQVHLEGLYATKPVFSKEGTMVQEDADFATRAKYLDMAYKRRGLYAAEKSVNLNIDTTQEPTDRIKELAKRMNQ